MFHIHEQKLYDHWVKSCRNRDSGNHFQFFQRLDIPVRVCRLLAVAFVRETMKKTSPPDYNDPDEKICDAIEEHVDGNLDWIEVVKVCQRVEESRKVYVGFARYLGLTIPAQCLHDVSWEMCCIAYGRVPTFDDDLLEFQKELIVDFHTFQGKLIVDFYTKGFYFDPQWASSDAVALARGIYADNAFDRMPILADCLQDAGCADEIVLGRLRDPEHLWYRGCWLLDILIEKR